MKDFDQTSIKNALLRSISPSAFGQLAPHLERVVLPVRETLETPEAAISHVHFPEPGVISVVMETPGGLRQEIGVIGPEGMTGLALLHGSDRSPCHVFVQISCRSYRIAAAPFLDCCAARPELSRAALRFSQSFTVQVGYTSLVNGRFALETRLARWLLMCQDRVDREEISLTHEFLSVMLGVRRASVTTGLHELEGQGVIRAQRGSVTIINRTQLRRIAGDAYGVPEAEYARLFPGLRIEAVQG